MLKQTLACVQFHQRLHCSNTCTKWAFIRHILSINTQTRLSMHAVLPEPSLLSHMHKMGVHLAFFQSMLRRDLVCRQSCQSLHCSGTYTKWVCLWHLLSVIAQTRLYMRAVSKEPSLLSTCAKWAYVRHILSVETQTRLCMHAVLPEPSLLSHMHKMGVYTAYSISQCSYAPEHACCLAKAFTALAHAQNGRSYSIFFQSKLRRALAYV